MRPWLQLTNRKSRPPDRPGRNAGATPRRNCWVEMPNSYLWIKKYRISTSRNISPAVNLATLARLITTISLWLLKELVSCSCRNRQSQVKDLPISRVGPENEWRRLATECVRSLGPGKRVDLCRRLLVEWCTFKVAPFVCQREPNTDNNNRKRVVSGRGHWQWPGSQPWRHQIETAAQLRAVPLKGDWLCRKIRYKETAKVYRVFFGIFFSCGFLTPAIEKRMG